MKQRLAAHTVMTRPTKAIHLICHSTKFGWRDLDPVEGRPGVFISSAWILKDVDHQSLVGGYLYLHETSYRGAGFAARILRIDTLPPKGNQQRFAFIVERIKQNGQRWRGRTPSQTRHHGGAVDANFPNELAAA
jgi:hypothetical protein